MLVFLALNYEHPWHQLSRSPDLGPAFSDLDMAKKYVRDQAEELGVFDHLDGTGTPYWRYDRDLDRELVKDGVIVGMVLSRHVVPSRSVRYPPPTATTNPLRIYHRLAAILTGATAPHG